MRFHATALSPREITDGLGQRQDPSAFVILERSRQPTGEEFALRRDLLTNLQILMEKRLLRIASRIHNHDALTQEILRVRDVSGACHDDLVMAAAPACWRAAKWMRLQSRSMARTVWTASHTTWSDGRLCRCLPTLL